MRGGVKCRLEFFQKFIRFGSLYRFTKNTHPTWPTSWALDAIISSHDTSRPHSSSSSNRPDPEQTGNGLATKS